MQVLLFVLHIPRLQSKLSSLTFPPPMSLRGISNMATILSVKFCHEGFIRVPDHKNAGVKGLNLLLTTLMGLDTYGSTTAPVISLPFETCTQRESKERGDHQQVRVKRMAFSKREQKVKLTFVVQ